jgi:hypothetical protein
MKDFWSANWAWLLVGLAVVWMLLSRGVGRGSGRPRSGRSTDARTSTGEGRAGTIAAGRAGTGTSRRGRVGPRTSRPTGADIAAAEDSPV